VTPRTLAALTADAREMTHDPEPPAVQAATHDLRRAAYRHLMAVCANKHTERVLTAMRADMATTNDMAADDDAAARSVRRAYPALRVESDR